MLANSRISDQKIHFEKIVLELYLLKNFHLANVNETNFEVTEIFTHGSSFSKPQDGQMFIKV